MLKQKELISVLMGEGRAQIGTGEVTMGSLWPQSTSLLHWPGQGVPPLHHKSMVPAPALWLEVPKRDGLWPREVQ